MKRKEGWDVKNRVREEQIERQMERIAFLLSDSAVFYCILLYRVCAMVFFQTDSLFQIKMFFIR